MPEIIVKLGDNVVQKYFFCQGSITIGRAADNDIVIENLAVSRVHAIIKCENGRTFIDDQGSSNGTFVNDVRLQRAEIMDRDMIAIGKHQLYFYDSRADARRPSLADQDRTMLVSTPALEHCTLPAELRVIKGRQKDESFALGEPRMTIGRGDEADIKLADWFVSKLHAEIERRGDKYILRDLGSWRHTCINGERVEERVLEPGDQITLGPTLTLQFGIRPIGPVAQPLKRIPHELAAADPEGCQPPALDSEANAGDANPLEAAERQAWEELLGSASDELREIAVQQQEARVVDELVESLAQVSVQSAAQVTTASYMQEHEREAAADAAAQPAESAEWGAAAQAEVRLWERALNNKSLMIRRQAARRLKQLTGKDYEYE